MPERRRSDVLYFIYLMLQLYQQVNRSLLSSRVVSAAALQTTRNHRTRPSPCCHIPSRGTVPLHDCQVLYASIGRHF